jgi:DNA-binding MarR family transcriptional regulator
MARERLSRLQRRILAWLVAEEQRLRGTMAADHQDLVRALAHHKGNLSTSLQGLERKGLIRVHCTPGGKAEAIDLTVEGRQQAKVLNKDLTTILVTFDDATLTALEEYAARHMCTVETMLRLVVWHYLAGYAEEIRTAHHIRWET